MVLFESLGGILFACVLFLASCGLGLLVIPSSIARPSFRALAGIPLFFIISTSCGLVFYLIWSTEVAVGGVVVFALGCVAFAVFRGVYTNLLRPREILLLAAFLFVGYAVMAFGWGESADGTIRALPGSWADGALHTLNAQAFSKDTQDSLAMPAFMGVSHREPFGYDLAAGFLLRGGFNIGSAFTLPAAGLLATLIAWSGLLSAQVLRQRIGENTSMNHAVTTYVVAGFLILFGGGLQWALMATIDNAWAPAAFFGIHDRMWNIQEEIGLIWANHINIFVSQKHLVLGLSFLVVLATVMYQTVHNRELIRRRRKLLFFLGVVTGLLSLFHAHVFLGAAMLWVLAFIISAYSAFFFMSGALAAIIASPVFFWYVGAVTREGFIGFAPGYLASHVEISWLLFWIINLGVFPFIAIFALTRKAHRNYWILLGIPAGFLFIIGNMIQLQPHLWDNIKLFQIAWILLLPFVVSELVVFMERKPYRVGYRTVGILILLTMSLTSLSELATYVNFRDTYPIYTPADWDVAHVLDARLPNNAAVLAASDKTHNHPVTLTGRTLASGYTGWIWSRGLPWNERLTDAKTVIRASSLEQLCAAIQKLPITHIIVTDIERFEWNNTISPFMRTFLKMDEPGVQIVPVTRVCD